MSSSNGRFSKFMQGKGFYVALAICLVGAGTAAWVAVDKTLDAIDNSNKSIIQNQSGSSALFPDLEEAGKSQSGITISSSSSSSSSKPESSSQPSSEPPARSAQAQQSPKLQPSSFILPIEGEIYNTFSKGELVKNSTLNEWRTHDAIDIKAAKGAEIKAVCDGKVINIRNDAMWGTVVEIEHHDKIVSITSGLAKDVKVKIGDTVKVGTVIGVVDSVPAEILDDSHIHFAMKKDNKWVDPLATMNKLKK